MTPNLEAPSRANDALAFIPKVGKVIPRLGKRMPRATSIADALFTATQQRVLGLLYGQPERGFAVSEVISLAGIGSGSVQRELARLSASGLVTVCTDGGRKVYRANRDAPVYEELRSLVSKTLGIPEQLREALAPIADEVKLAVLFGSVAKGSATASSDVDLLLVADDLTLEEVLATLEPLEQRLGRRVDPTLYTSEELARRRRDRSPFLRKVLAGDHIVLIGDEDELGSSR